MSRRFLVVVVISVATIAPSSFAQNSTSTNPGAGNATCNFDSQKQLAVEYQRVDLGKKAKNYLGEEVPYGKVWEPGKKPLTLFTNSAVRLDGTNIPAGAYTLYLVPNRDKWTLVVSKNTDESAKYDKSKDLVRAPMQIGQLPTAEPQFSVYFAHTAPTECSMRIDLADTRAWVPFDLGGATTAK